MVGERVLVTGGTGLIGSQVAAYLLARRALPILVDLHPNQDNISQLPSDVVVRAMSVEDGAGLLRICRDHQVTHIVHLAALLTMDSSRAPAEAITTNCVGTATIFELAGQAGVRRTVWTSTAGVYGERPYYERLLGRHLVDEDDPVAPYDLYGGTKQLCEVLARQYAAGGSGRPVTDIVGLRPVMTFGVGRLSGAVGVLNRAFRDAALSGHGIITAPWSAGTSINPMYVKDCADVIVTTLLHPEPLSRSIYNLGTGEYLSLQEMVDAALSMMSLDSRIEFEEAIEESAPQHVPRFDYPNLDSRALREEVGWQPRFDFGAAVAECLQLYREAAA